MRIIIFTISLLLVAVTIVSPVHGQLTINPTTFLNSNALSDTGSDRGAKVVTDGLGNWVAAWDSSDDLGGTIGTDRDILVSRSSDDGATWTAPQALNTNAGTDQGADSFGQTGLLATDGAGNWVATWASQDDLGGTIGTDYDVLLARSTDDGATWTAPQAVNDNAVGDDARDFPSGLATDQQGNWVMVFLSEYDIGGLLGADYDVLYSLSTDHGATWTPLAALDSNAGTDSVYEFNAQVISVGPGSFVTVWESRNDLGGTVGPDDDIFVSRSTDGGATWSPAQTLNTNAASDGADDDNPKLATDGSGNVVVTWYSGDGLGGTIGSDLDILVTRSADFGVTWAAPQALNDFATSDSAVDEDPVIATDGRGNWVVTWQSSHDVGGLIGPDDDILLSRSTDDGVSWTPAQALNTNAGSDSGFDKRSSIAPDGCGNWVTIWDSFETLGGAVGFDDDIFVTRFTLPVSWSHSFACSPVSGGVNLSLSVGCGTPGNTWFVPMAFAHPGVAPNGWFFGIDLEFSELLMQINAGAPWIGTLDAGGRASYTAFLPGGACPVGLTMDSVALEFSGSSLVQSGTAFTTNL